MRRAADAPWNQDRHSSIAKVGSGRRPPLPATEGLTEDQKRLLDCLHLSQTGMTKKQIQLSLACPDEVVDSALVELVRLDLVCELNTIVPSYLSRYPGIRLYS